MKELKNYETCEIEIIPLADVITSSGGIDGDEDDFGFGTTKAFRTYEW